MRGVLTLLLLLSLVGGATRGAQAQTSTSGWADNFNLPGANGNVSSVVQTSDAVYIGGNFTTVGNVAANHVARYDKVSGRWSSLGTGGANGVEGVVNALAVSGNDVYVGGIFSTVGGSSANRIAKWNGSAWSSLGTGVANGSVYALAVSGNDLYVGGYFSSVGGNSAHNIAKWNGSTWSPLGVGVANEADSYVNALTVIGSNLYAGGYFTMAGGITANNIAKWNGSGWSSLGTGSTNGVDSFATALAVSGTDLYVAGGFTTAGGITANCIARWNGSTWSSLGTGSTNGVYGSVNALAVIGSDVYVGGYFTTAGGTTANNIAKWNGSAWSSLGMGSVNGVDRYIYVLAVSGTDLYVGGGFSTAGGRTAKYIAKWDGSAWSSVARGDGMNGIVFSVVDAGDAIYVGGDFTCAGGVTANHVAKWNKSSRTWSSLGVGSANGVEGVVNALAVSGNDVYVGGIFSAAGGTAANNIAKWNGSAWSSLGAGSTNGVDSYVGALAVIGSNLYVGGNFSTAGGIEAKGVAKWNGSAWSSLGTGSANGVDGYANAFGVIGSNLYVGGSFTTAGDTSANYVAKWDGSAWSSLGTSSANGTDSYIYALAVSGNDVYVGGNFSTAGGIEAKGVAKWNGSAWSSLSMVNGSVRALAVSGNDVYIGGNLAGDMANYVATWNGSGWASLGTITVWGGAGVIYTLAVIDNGLYVGGEFDTVEGKLSNNIAQYGPLNHAPVITSNGSGQSDSVHVAEGTLAVTTVAATDADAGQTLSYGISGGTDAALFHINPLSGALRFLVAPDYELPGDADSDNVYEVTIQVSDDGVPVKSDTQALSVTVTNVNEAPVISTTSLPNGLTRAAYSQTLAASDPDGNSLSWSVSAGTLPTGLTLSSSGVLSGTPTVAGTFNFTVAVGDGNGGLDSKPLTLIVTLNTSPIITVTSPNNGASIVRTAFLTTLSGNASDDIGVKNAWILFFRNRNGAYEFWNGTAWGTTQTFVLLQLASAGATSTIWNWTQKAPAASDLDSGAYGFRVYATDKDSTASPQVSRDFYLTAPANNPAPAITVTAPNNGASIVRTAFLTTLSGNATDDLGVRSAGILFFRNRNGTLQFWNGTIWGTTQTFVPLQLASAGSTSTTWSWTQKAPAASDLDSGTYGFRVYATDKDNAASAQVARDFYLIAPANNPAPVITVTAPNNGQRIVRTAFLTTLSGNATDDLGVKDARILFFRNRNGALQFWNGTAWGTTQVYVPLLLASAGSTSTGWSWNQKAPSASDLDNGAYGFRVYATDKDSAASAQVARDFYLTAPANGVAPPIKSSAGNS